jgi:hypothetical protein
MDTNISKILHNHICTGLFNFFSNNDKNDWYYNIIDNKHLIHKIYNKRHLYIIIYINIEKDETYDIYQYYYELTDEINNIELCPIFENKIKYKTNNNIALINNRLLMICHQDYLFNELLLLELDELDNFLHIFYRNKCSYTYFFDENEYINNTYIFNITNDQNTIIIFLDTIKKTITIYENDDLYYNLNYNIYNPNLIY